MGGLKIFPAFPARLGAPGMAAAGPGGVQASLEHFYLSRGHNYFGHHGREASGHPTVAADELRCVGGRGILGDRFFDYRPDYAGQITFFAHEVFEELRLQLGFSGSGPEATRRNVITRGLDLGSLFDREFCLQGVGFRGAGECKPCYWMDAAIAPGSEAWLKGRGGLRARILTSGVLRLGAADFAFWGKGIPQEMPGLVVAGATEAGVRRPDETVGTAMPGP